ncbi:rhamnulokinase [Nakamurella endophytica]|uniref:rhamnulokinase n=1 Tax=Nakamurella endophytica TaxID=1748367 RepID=UPI001E5F9B37|nr:rhamnulokinase family protein [Nakamurella endophytica]
MTRFAAVDLGASSGRVMAAAVDPHRLELTELHRFRNGAVPLGGKFYWDALGLWLDVLHGLSLAGDVHSVGIDTWGVDYGLLDARGDLLANPRHYRDGRTIGLPEELDHEVPPADLYRRTGLQRMAINTVYQLRAERSALLPQASGLLLMPDLFGYWLTGVRTTELTIASTTNLLDPVRRDWDRGLLELAGVSADLLGPLREPGTDVAPITAEVAAATGLSPDVRWTAVGSHDTASAVVGVPAEGEDFAYIACGTWGLAGIELSAPVLTEDSRAANFTNEAGVDGTVRYLRNVMGLWVLSECLREWRDRGRPAELAPLLEAAAAVPPGGPVFDVDDLSLLPPGPMQQRIARLCGEAGQPVPASAPEVVRSVLDSLATAFARAVRDAARLSGRTVSVVHLVGGGARNSLLCQLTADAAGLPVVAGPVEATALGNVLVQARAQGVLTGSLADLRALVRGTQELRTFQPRSATEAAR